MPYYAWTGVDVSAVYKKGVSFARNSTELDQLLFKRDIALVRCGIASKWHALGRIKQQSLLGFFDQLAVLLDAGVALPQALQMIAQQLGASHLGDIVQALAHEVSEGQSLSVAMQGHPDLFDTIMVRMVHVGSEVGCLAACLQALSDYLEVTTRFERKVRAALVTPCVTLIFFLVITLIIFIGIVPRFEHIFASFGKELPFITQVVLHISYVLRSWWALVVACGAIGFFLVFRRSLLRPSGKSKRDEVVLQLPVIGTLVAHTALVCVARAMSMLLAGGMQVAPALRIAQQVVGNEQLQQTLADWHDRVIAGSSLGSAMLNNPGKMAPADVVALVSVGQESAKLDVMFKKIADAYQEKVQRSLHIFTNSINPIIMALLGVLVTALIFAIYIPVFNLAQII